MTDPIKRMTDAAECVKIDRLIARNSPIKSQNDYAVYSISTTLGWALPEVYKEARFETAAPVELSPSTLSVQVRLTESNRALHLWIIAIAEP